MPPLTSTEQQIQDLQTQLTNDVEPSIIVASNNLLAAENQVATRIITIDRHSKKHAYAKNYAQTQAGGCGDGNLFPVTNCFPGVQWFNIMKTVEGEWNADSAALLTLQANVVSKKGTLKGFQDQKSSIQAQINDLLAAQAAQVQAELDTATAEALADPETIKLGLEADKALKALELDNRAKMNQALIVGAVIVAVVLGGIILFVQLRKTGA